MTRTILVFIAFTLLAMPLFGQYKKEYHPMDAGEIKLALEKANTLGTVLYLAAHPDDENTELITYLTKEQNVRTGYQSITRGDGGQNLIGPEKGKLMGLIRTHELLEAREIDGGHQFFTRANDFSYSKTAKETLSIWNREKVLADMVWTIRKFKPDVIITRFPSEGYDGHGHHTASAILAEEAFDAAANPDRFKEQLDHVDTWQPKRLLFNTSHWFYRDKDEEFSPSNFLGINVGMYNPLLGQSYTEIAAVSQSQHKSQGFGAPQRRGKQIDYLDHTKGEKAQQNIFEGVNMRWSRVEGGSYVGEFIDQAISSYNADRPHKSISLLTQAYKALKNVKNDHWREVKRHEIKKIIAASNGLWFEATSEDFSAAPGTEMHVNASIVNRGPYDFTLKRIELPFGDKSISYNEQLPENEKVTLKDSLTVPHGTSYSHPFWMRKEMTSKGMYTVNDQQLRDLPRAKPQANVKFVYEVDGAELTFTKPVEYKWTDPAEGERYRPFIITPPVTTNIADKVYVFADDKSKSVNITVKAGKDDVSGTLKPGIPDGWEAQPAQYEVDLAKKGDEKTFSFAITPPSNQEKGKIRPFIQMDDKVYRRSMASINYGHIPVQQLFPDAASKLVRLNIDKKGSHVGYIMGAGDEIPSSLKQMGYQVTMLDESNFGETNLSQFDAIVVGIRAYNTVDQMKHRYDRLMEYVKDGGTMVVQYSKSYNQKTDKIGPYDFQLSHNRITVEEAELTMLDADHPIFNQPNNITQKDFEGWIHERGLYFADEWSKEYTPLLSGHDPNEPPRKGGLLVTDYGEGAFIYTGYSFFRQLPAGNPGAFRLFANLVSYRGSDK